MITLFRCKGLKKDFGEQSVLKNINFEISVGERVGIVGNNGAGKTTLANIINGSERQDDGCIIWCKKNISIGYLVQSTYFTSNAINKMYSNKKENIDNFLETSSKLGITKLKLWNNSKFDGLSGGEKTKLALSDIWSKKPDLLILDEPTNHLDMKGTKWLINEVGKYEGTIITISHDRYFLDETCERILEIEEGEIFSYKGNYSSFREQKQLKYETQMNEYINQEKYKQKIKKEINQLKNWSTIGHDSARKKAIQKGMKFGGKEYYRAKAKKKDKQIKSKLKRLEKLSIEGVDKPKENLKLNFNINNTTKKGKRIVVATDISKSFGNFNVFNKSSFYIQRGDRVGLIGDNGCGKTTLIKILMGQLNVDSGNIYVSKSSKIGYMSQDVLDMTEDKSVLELFDIENNEIRNKVKHILSNIGFSETLMRKKIKDLSLGERTRLKIAQLVLNNNNILILDEPTNHLDLNSREKLEETLEKFLGTIIIASHDRYLLEKICDKLLIFKEHKIKRINLTYKDYIANKEKKYEKSKTHNKNNELIIQNRIAYILGELSKYNKDDERYKKLDKEFKKLINYKNNQ